MDAIRPAKFNVGWRGTWDERLHIIEETIADELGLSKYRRPYFYCCGGGRPVLRSIVEAHFTKHGCDPKLMKPVLIHCSILNKNIFV
jgi:hypothetical protein